ncbi:MAG: radical SAM protein [Desulfohalobiaceae bacterium]|nr:radical SAM protein [Desulfohalobiaceae bacterium]
MSSYHLDDLQISLNTQGASRYQKVSFPVQYGLASQIQTPRYSLRYNLNGAIISIQGRTRDWPHPAEWLKRTLGNDWVYYFSGNYTHIVDALGEYYLPCFPYPSNSLWNRHPFAEPAVQAALDYAQDQLPRQLSRLLAAGGLQPELRDFLETVARTSRARLWERSRRLFSILKSRVSVLPPDARHVDYDLLPLIIADGCLYNCGFCSVKTGQAFQPRSRKDILEQILGLRSLLGPDLRNYNSLFLGQHDALHCDPDLLEYAALKAYTALGFARSVIQDPTLHCFAGVDAFLNKRDSFFQRCARWPYRTFINIGLESADQSTLDQLHKPVSAEKNQEAFHRAQEVNQRWEQIEVTTNFVLSPDLPDTHWSAFEDLTRSSLKHYYPKGTVYLSPLSRLHRQESRRLFARLKRRSRRPTYLYLLQRL